MYYSISILLLGALGPNRAIRNFQEQVARSCLRREHGDTDPGISRSNNIISGTWILEAVHPVLGSRDLANLYDTADASPAAVLGFL